MKETLSLFSNGADGGAAPALSAAAREVAAVLESSPGPWTVAQIRKQWARKAAVIEAALLELEARGAAHRLPGTRAAALWSAWPLERWLDEAAERAVEAARAAASPAPEKKLIGAVWPKGLHPEPFQQRLAALGREGRLHCWPGKTPAWWHLGREEAMAEALLAVLGDRALERKQWLREARARLRGSSAAEWQQAAAELIASGRVMAHATRLEGRRVEACVRAEHRGALLEIYRPVIERLREEWRRLGIREEHVRRFLEPRGAGAAELLLEELRRLERESPPPNPVARLRRRAALQALSKEEFDRAALELLHQGRVYMAPHDHPMGLTVEEREGLVKDGSGNFYVSISSRP